MMKRDAHIRGLAQYVSTEARHASRRLETFRRQQRQAGAGHMTTGPRTGTTGTTDLDHEDARTIDAGAAEDRAYRKAYGGHADTPFGGRLRSAYVAIIGDAPHCGPGDHDRARGYLERVQRAIDQGGWTSAERTRLYRLRDKWQARADGVDARFEIAGTRAGRLDTEQEAHVRALNERARKQQPLKPRRSRRKKDVDWSAFEDLDAPFGQARGGPGIEDLEGDAGEDETGEAHTARNRSVMTDRDFLIPGQDQKGHSHRVQCRVMPAHFRALSIIYTSKKFPFRTLGDIVRWCADYGIRELGRLGKVAQIESVLGQVDAIKEILGDEQYHQDFSGIFDQLSSTVSKHSAAGALGEARRVVAIVKMQIEKMPEGYWRTRYLDELHRQFGHLLDGDQDGVQLLG